MTEDKTKMDFRGRDRVAANEAYDPRAIRYFAAKFGLDIGQVLELAKHGNDREALQREQKRVGHDRCDQAVRPWTGD